MATLPAWFADPPVVGGPDTYTLVEATTQAQYDQYHSLGYPEFNTQAAAQSFINTRNNSLTLSPNPASAAVQAATGNDTAAGQSKGILGDITAGITGFSGTNFVLRAVKVIIGGVLLLIGLAHITGADNQIMNAARKVPVVV
jgi:hypothetical protein